MERIRVIGRIDLAQQVHAALLAAGADAHVATAAPMAVVSATGRDGSSIDVLANALDVCPGIKEAAPERPVVLVIWNEPGSDVDVLTMMVESAAKTARGPDAYLRWPATGPELLAACERAKEASRIRRPRVRWRATLARVAGVLGIGAVVWALWALRTESRAAPSGISAAPSLWPRLVLQLAQTGLFAVSGWWSWRRARTSSRPRWHRGWAIFGYAYAGLSFLGAVALLLR
jgi:hypothetical protein